MASATAEVADAVFEELGVDATYTPAAGVPVAVRIRFSDGSTDLRLHGSIIRSAARTCEIRVFDAPALAAGDGVTVDGQDLVVQGEPQRIKHGLVWLVELVPA